MAWNNGGPVGLSRSEVPSEWHRSGGEWRPSAEWWRSGGGTMVERRSGRHIMVERWSGSHVTVERWSGSHVAVGEHRYW